MRYSSEHKERARARILEATGRGFRRAGFGGIGVDGLAKAAGVTSGAFYGYFNSKDEAFKQSLIKGLEELRLGIATCKAQFGNDWIGAFVAFYLGERLRCDLSEACALQALTADVMRAGADIKQAYSEGITAVVQEMTSGLTQFSEADAKQKSWALLSFLSGAVSMLRGLDDAAQAASIAENLKGCAMRLME